MLPDNIPAKLLRDLRAPEDIIRMKTIIDEAKRYADWYREVDCWACLYFGVEHPADLPGIPRDFKMTLWYKASEPAESTAQALCAAWRKEQGK